MDAQGYATTFRQDTTTVVVLNALGWTEKALLDSTKKTHILIFE
jgi:hypothetical protein